MINEISTSADAAGHVAQVLRQLADPTRLRLLSLLPDGEKNVTELCRCLGSPQPTVSHHLGLLRSAGLVENRRRGKEVFYSLNRNTIRPVEGGGLAIHAGPVELQVLDPDPARRNGNNAGNGLANGNGQANAVTETVLA